MNIGQANISAAESVGELLVIHGQQVEDGRPQIINRADILHRVVPEFIGGSLGRAALDATAGQPDAEPKRIVIPSGGRLRKGRPAEFPGPDDEGLVEQTARLPIPRIPKWQLRVAN